MRAFVRESNRIEGIVRKPTEPEVAAHAVLMLEPKLTVSLLEGFVGTIAGAQLRDKPGMDVSVGAHLPMPGGEVIREALEDLLSEINAGVWPPHQAHVRYELLHPFMDGNGRSGRILWAWQMKRDGHNPFALPFLHRWYYDSLAASR